MPAAAKSDAKDLQPAVERQLLRLEIDPVIARAESLAAYVQRELPSHDGLTRVAQGVTQIAREAKQVSRRLRRPIGWHRLPAAFLIVSLLLLCGLIWQFLHTPTLKIAIPREDGVKLRTETSRLELTPIYTDGDREDLEKLEDEVDLAYVQGGIPIPDRFQRAELEQSELVLLFLRESLSHPNQMRKIITSDVDQGSHSLAKIFARYWRIDDKVQFIHDWHVLTDDAKYHIADDIEAVFVVKDPGGKNLEGTSARLATAGFRLVSPDIGANSQRLEYLRSYTVLPDELNRAEQIPQQPVATYAVVTYLVGRQDLRTQQLAEAQRLIHPDHSFPVPVAEPSLNMASEVAQGLQAALDIAIKVGIAFLGLWALEAVASRRRFHELNSLVSLISMHQSSKDVITGSRTEKAHNVTYLSVCSDLLGLIAVITGYYTQENSSLVYNRLSDIIHERCDGLKINIQLKILHALIDLPRADEADGKQPAAESPRTT